MAPTHYDNELAKLAETYRGAMAADIEQLKSAIAGASESSIIGVGSGGSFTTASLLCAFHETYTGRISRPSTPLEIICKPSLAAASPVFLVSAEGKNPDIIEALQRARTHSARPIHMVTNRSVSPLIDTARGLSSIGIHVFELAEKDGYLATNSLLLNAVLLARAYVEIDNETERLPATIEELALGESSIDDWLLDAAGFVREATVRGCLILTFSPVLRPVASDLESKLAESALLHCQVADLRSFAHGRHLWLADRPSECTVLAMIEPSLLGLWEGMRPLLPPEVPTLTMPFADAKPHDLLAGLVAQMRLVAAIAEGRGRDPGRPNVPQFGRNLHYIDLRTLIPAPSVRDDHGTRSKYEALGARWPSIRSNGGPMRRASESFAKALEEQVFRAIVFDYDGTLCTSQRNDKGPPEPIVAHLSRLVDAGVVVGIATGRGGSVQEDLQRSLPERCWAGIHLGLYNAGCIVSVASLPAEENATSEFLSHVTRIVGRLKAIGVPIKTIRTTHPYQVSVRFSDGVLAEGLWFVIADALREAGLDLSRVVRSKHSVDILSVGVNKSRLIVHIIQQLRLEPYDVLTLGDQGAWPGNDSCLLDHRYSLSVDSPSRRLDRGWKLAPAHKRDVDATLWYLERIVLLGGGRFRVQLSGRPEVPGL